MILEAIFLPSTTTELASKVCIVIDVLRATSTLVSMFEAGARRVILSDSHDAALSLAASLPDRPLVCGESGGLPPAGFDRGNSPREFLPGELHGDLVFCTTNGTRALRLVAGAPVVLTGSMLNGRAVVRAALAEARARSLNIAMVCSGDFLGTRFAIDDAYCAAHLLSEMLKEMASAGIPAPDLDESAVAALRLYNSYLSELRLPIGSSVPREAVLRAFWESHNALVLRRVGLAEDVDYCAQLDISSKVPRLRVVAAGGLVLEA